MGLALEGYIFKDHAQYDFLFKSSHNKGYLNVSGGAPLGIFRYKSLLFLSKQIFRLNIFHGSVCPCSS